MHMKLSTSQQRLAKFIAVLALLFGLPLLAVGKTTLETAHSKQNVPVQGGNKTPGTVRGTPALPTGSDWPTYLHDIQRTSTTNETILSPANAGRLTRLWSFKTSNAIASSATVVAGTVYFGSWDGNEYALDMLTGHLKWKKFLGQTTADMCYPRVIGITSSATVQNNVVYVGGGDAYWYALDANTGDVLWKVYTGDTSAQNGHYNWSSPLLYNGYAYIGVASNCDKPLVQGQVLQVSLQTHRIVHTFKVVPDGQTGGGIWTSPSVDPATNTLFISSGTETGPQQQLAQAVFSLDASTLTLKSWWKLPAKVAIGDSDFDTSPILFNDANGTPLVAAVNKNGYVYVFNRNDIAAGPVWTQLIDIAGMCPLCEESSVSSNTVGGGALYVAAGNTNINGTNYRGSVDALDVTTGKFLWRHGVQGAVIGSLVYVNGLIIDGAGPDVEVLDAKTGKRLYSYHTGNMTYASPSLAHGIIFEGSADGNEYAFSLPTTTDTQASSTSTTTCPRAWTCQDIGNPALSGSETRAGSTWTIKAGGTGITDLDDQFHFVSQPVSGDLQISAKALSQQSTGTGQTAQVGLMVRQNADAASSNYGVFLTDHTGVVVQYRAGSGTETKKVIQLPAARLPLYLMIQRQGDQFQAAISHDGSSYTLVPGSDTTLAMPTDVHAGFAVSSAEASTVTQAVYSELAIGAPTTAPTLPPSKGVCPPAWNCTDIGNPAITGSQTVDNGQWTVQGAGINIWWDRTDMFHFVSQPMTGDGSLSARVVSQSGPTPHLKSGVEMRQSTASDAPYYAMYAEPDGGTDGKHGIVEVEWRVVQGLSNRQILIVDSTTPVYLKITRKKDVFSAYISSDGIRWKFLNDSKIGMANTALVGLAVTAKDVGAVNTTVFTNVRKQQ